MSLLWVKRNSRSNAVSGPELSSLQAPQIALLFPFEGLILMWIFVHFGKKFLVQSTCEEFNLKTPRSFQYLAAVDLSRFRIFSFYNFATTFLIFQWKLLNKFIFFHFFFWEIKIFAILYRKDICRGGSEVSFNLNFISSLWSEKFFKWNYSFGQIEGLLSAALDENEHKRIMDVICKSELIVKYWEQLNLKIEEQQHNLCSQGGITIMTDYNLLMRNFYNGC